MFYRITHEVIRLSPSHSPVRTQLPDSRYAKRCAWFADSPPS